MASKVEEARDELWRLIDAYKRQDVYAIDVQPALDALLVATQEAEREACVGRVLRRHENLFIEGVDDAVEAIRNA